MAKRKAKAVGQRAGKTRVELRLDNEVFDGVKALADQAEVNLNQLINGLCRWAAANGHAGEANRDEDGKLYTKQVPGTLWFGQPGRWLPEEAVDAYEDAGMDFENPTKGTFYFGLDYTERRVVLDEI